MLVATYSPTLNVALSLFECGRRSRPHVGKYGKVVLCVSLLKSENGLKLSVGTWMTNPKPTDFTPFQHPHPPFPVSYPHNQERRSIRHMRFLPELQMPCFETVTRIVLAPRSTTVQVVFSSKRKSSTHFVSYQTKIYLLDSR